MKREELRKKRRIGGVNVELLIKEAREFVNTEPVPEGRFKYRKGKITASQTSPTDIS